jgi:hypothetical protein
MGLRDLHAAFAASALDPETIIRARFLTAWHRRFAWDDEATWPYFAERLDWLARQLDPAPGTDRAWSTGMLSPAEQRTEALAVLATFPEPPARLVPRLWEFALGSSKTDRPRAQKCLEKLPDCAHRLFELLGSRNSKTRSLVTDWIARLKPDGAAQAIRSALATETTSAVRSALAGALEAVGGIAESDRGATGDPRRALEAEAARGLKAGIPAKYSWFPFNGLPEAHWRDDGSPVDPQIVSWLVVSAWKTKSAEPSAILREQVGLLREDDVQAIGNYVLESWLTEDLRPPSPEELQKRLGSWMQTTGAATIDEIALRAPGLAQAVEFEKNRPMSVRAEDKGVLALAAACGPVEMVERIRTYITQWYGYRAAQCRSLVQVLAGIDHPDALAFLLDVAGRFRTASIRLEAEMQTRKLAERRGVSVAELADLALPDAGLDAEGKLVLDYGPRKFAARLDDDAEIELTDESGDSIKSLPAPKQSDDPELAEKAKKRFSELKKQVKAIRKRVVDRFYEAMCTQRSWTFADWQRTIHRHPIAGRLARRVVWTVGTKAAFETVRPLEDGTLTDLNDNQVEPSPGDTVRIAHRMIIGEPLAARWQVHLADFEIEPLIPEFLRRGFRVPKDSREAKSWPLPLEKPLAVPGLTRQARGLGYDPAAFRVEDGGGCFIKHFPSANLRAEIEATDFDNKDNATRLALTFRPSDAPRTLGVALRSLPLGEIPPVLFSECHADLMALGGGTAGDEADDDAAQDDED